MERTFIAIKPDGVQRGLIGDIVTRFERKGFKLAGLKLMQVSKAMAEEHYGEHKDKPFFGGLVEFITSGPIVAMVWEGSNVVLTARQMMGATNPKDAAPGTIRGDLSVDLGRNVIHGSDSVASAEREIGIFFQPAELVSGWCRSTEGWVYEKPEAAKTPASCAV
ncbi:MAG: nucleoside-diphosphate kinase [Candidatus Melainabacteria bacterium]